MASCKVSSTTYGFHTAVDYIWLPASYIWPIFLNISAPSRATACHVAHAECSLFYLILNWLRGNMCEFVDGPLWRGGDSGSQAMTHSWSLRSTSRPPGLNVYPADVAASPSSLLLIVLSTASLSYSSPLQNESRRRCRHHHRPPPPSTPFPLQFTGSRPRHGNDVIKRKKWSAEKESLREWRTQWRYAASTLRSATLRRRGSEPSRPLSPAACLLLFRVMRWWCHWP